MTVITSKEQEPYLLGWDKYRNTAEIEVTHDYVIWRFKSAEDAEKAAEMFMNLGCEYVRRILK